jgi:hypothetical protein
MNEVQVEQQHTANGFQSCGVEGLLSAWRSPEWIKQQDIEAYKYLIEDNKRLRRNAMSRLRRLRSRV